ncbi:Rieske (2Fe-2S) protein, partial [Bradyrhizobium sp.]
METLFAICATYEVDDGGARGFVLQRREPDGTAKPWPILVTRKGNHFYGFENACPHQGARLDQRAGEFMDEEGNFLVCGQHGARFDLDTGKCFIGPCQGSALAAIKLVID